MAVTRAQASLRYSLHIACSPCTVKQTAAAATDCGQTRSEVFVIGKQSLMRVYDPSICMALGEEAQHTVHGEDPPACYMG